ncbi:TonB-dependent siderophore receptor [Mitsuaria sp. 7]|uniref:TonB-dependent receptor plug domain-containing protein n=1 Tax=Mitsuaria sp. 7 TaxID=1658665 RepID=UPI0009EED18B|nr:TonB-dependent receptor [Mitsuaria sp. 7]
MTSRLSRRPVGRAFSTPPLHAPTARGPARPRLSHFARAALLLAGGEAAFAQDSADAGSSTAATAAASGTAAIVVPSVLVTGARAEPRTVQSSPTPVDVFSADAIDGAARAGLLETLNSLVPSFNLPNWVGFGNSTLVRGGQLRGLNPDHTLVLINGKRRHSTALLGAGGFTASAPADLSLIPTGAIERIEVLRDGASALYGSDAIAGVINIITRQDREGGSVQARVGEYYEGDGLTQQYQGHLGLPLGKDGHLSLAAQYDKQRPVFRDSPVPSTFLFYFPRNAAGQPILPSGSLASNPTLPAGATPDPREATRNSNQVFGLGGLQGFELGSLSADAGLDLGAGIEVYGLATYAHRKARAPQYFRHPSRDEVVRALYPDGFTPFSGITENDLSATAGVRGGEATGWRWDVSAGVGRDDIDTYIYNSVSPTYGLASQRDFFLGNQTYTAYTANGDLRRTLDIGGLASELSLGTELRQERFKRGVGDEQSWGHGGQPVLDGPNAGKALGNGFSGSQADTGNRPEDVINAKRHSEAVYLGLSLKPLRDWVVDTAVRREKFSDFGSTTTGRLATRFEIASGFALRGSVSSGFHAPPLAAQSQRATDIANDYANHQLRVSSPEAIALGAKPLKPEKSDNLSLGVVASPLQDLNVAVDVYQIKVKNRIATSTSFREALYPGTGALVQAAGLGFADGINYFINAADTRTRGIDVTLDGAFKGNGWGRLRWSAALNYNETVVSRVADTPAVLQAYNVPVFSVAQQNTLKYLAPRDKEIFTLNWSRNDWSVQTRLTHYGTIKRVGSPATIPTTGPWAGQREIVYDVGNLWTTDLEIAWKVTPRVRLALTANNLFDRKPATLPDPLLNKFQSYAYVNNGPITGAGGFYAVSARVDF